MGQLNPAILIVEDDVDIRESLQQFLEMESFDVYTAENGLQGLESLKKMGRHCLVLLDLFMPIMTGAEFLSELKLRNPTFLKEFPVVIMSAAPPDGEVVRSVKSFAADYIKKPVDLDDLLRVIQKYTSAEKVA